MGLSITVRPISALCTQVYRQPRKLGWRPALSPLSACLSLASYRQPLLFKFEADRFKNGRDLSNYVISRWQLAAILFWQENRISVCGGLRLVTSYLQLKFEANRLKTLVTKLDFR